MRSPVQVVALLSRTRRVATTALAAALLAVACRGGAGGPGSGAAPPAGGSPTAPLPAPLAIPAGPADEAAAVLARRILDGGREALPALLAALRAGGIAVRGPGGVLPVQPPDQGQGLAVSAWEARFMAGLVGKDRMLLVPLTAFQDVLVRAAPELQGVPIAQHILDGIRTHAQGPDGPMRTWARLIVELGRQRQTGGAQDLLGQVGPAEVRLDAVQLSLITVRLIGDLEVLSAAIPGGRAVAEDGRVRDGLKAVRPMFSPRGWLAPRAVYAAQPCAADDSPVVSRERVSAGGFDVLKGIIRERVSKSLLGRMRKEVRDYNTLVLVLAALRIEVAMDPPGPPLVRTKTTDPGEERTITARVYLDPATLGTVECARALLAALGLRFNVGNPAGGGIAGVPLTWSLTAGQDLLLMQVGGGQSETDQDGRDTLAVLGAPQTRNLGSNPQRVSKQAAVTVGFDLRPYTLLGTTPGPGGPLTPPEFLLNLSYRYVMTYPFEVVDWEGGGKWTGTITYTETVRKQHLTQGERGGLRSHETSTLRIQVELGEVEWEIADPGTGAAQVILKGTARGEYALEGSSSGWYQTDCWAHKGVRLNAISQHQMQGSGSGTAKISITLGPSDYIISVDAEGSFEVTGTRRNQSEVCQGGGVGRRSESTALGPVAQGLDIPRSVGGSFGPRDPRDALRGTLTDTQSTADADNPGITTTTTWTITWDLRRR